MKRVVILGRGAAGKSTLARRLGAIAGLPIVELDKHFWQNDLSPLPADRWKPILAQFVEADAWIIDGDLGPFDTLETRLRVADTVVLLDFPLQICAWRALLRSRENLAFWRWVICYRRTHLPCVVAAVAEYAPGAQLHLLRHPRDVKRFLAEAAAAKQAGLLSD